MEKRNYWLQISIRKRKFVKPEVTSDIEFTGDIMARPEVVDYAHELPTRVKAPRAKTGKTKYISFNQLGDTSIFAKERDIL